MKMYNKPNGHYSFSSTEPQGENNVYNCTTSGSNSSTFEYRLSNVENCTKEMNVKLDRIQESISSIIMKMKIGETNSSTTNSNYFIERR
jgi:hypothetical protein